MKNSNLKNATLCHTTIFHAWTSNFCSIFSRFEILVGVKSWYLLTYIGIQTFDLSGVSFLMHNCAHSTLLNCRNWVVCLFKKSNNKTRQLSCLFLNGKFFRMLLSPPTIRLLKVRHAIGALIMTNSRPLLQATFEVILLHPPTIWFWFLTYLGIELGSFRSWIVNSTPPTHHSCCVFLNGNFTTEFYVWWAVRI